MRIRDLVWLCTAATLIMACGAEGPTNDNTGADKSISGSPTAEDGVEVTLPAYELPWEKKVPGKADAYDDFRAANPQWYAITEVPKPNTYRHMTEWEPMQILYTTYSDSMPSDPQVAKTIVDIVKSTVLDAKTKVGVIYEKASAKTDLTNRLLANGMTQTQINSMVFFHQIKNETIWHIDYGPVPLLDMNDTVALGDFRYYHQRVEDDAIPTQMGSYYKINTFRMPVNTEGGNFQGDGEGTCYTSQRGLQYAGMTQAQFHQVWSDYLACTKQLVVLKDITDDGTGHIDMFFKLVDKTTAIMGEYKTPYVTDATNKKRMDDNQVLLEGTTVAGGSKIKVHRMPFPSKKDGIPRTYINSTFVNGVNLWPIYTDMKAAEAEALAVWQQVMPTYKHVGIISDKIASYSGTIHCITRTLPVGTYKPWIADGTCTGGKCTAPAGGYSGTCNAAISCSGPEWLCECNDCKFCGPGAPPKSCVGFCGGQSDAGCYCDELCKQYNDCCEDYDQACLCVPSCAGKKCGDNGCGGSCGTCAAGTACNAAGQCESVCKPDCAGKTCGDNGCGGSCGTCGGGSTCTNGQCVANCVPACSGKACGADGCGGSCGTCAQGTSCNNAGQCVANCAPSCSGKQCGNDGCGGSCGSCSNGQSCIDGQCVAECAPQCAGKECGDDGCGGSCGTCSGGEVCTAGTCSADCGPSCEGKQCGDDGCGGSCGTCENGQTCTAAFQCESSACVPACGDAECGADGCGGSCGSCDVGQECQLGECVSTADPLDTCENRCGNYDDNAECQCDTECGTTGDCCEDICDHCKDNSTCDNECVCPAVEEPVCGKDGITYGNDCLAACASVEVDHQGACIPSSPDIVGGGDDTSTDPDGGPTGGGDAGTTPSDTAAVSDTAGNNGGANPPIGSGATNGGSNQRGGCAAYGTPSSGGLPLALLIMAMGWLTVRRRRSA